MSIASPVFAIVQARMGSVRFPGKMLAPLGNHSLLEWVLQRVMQARMLDGVVLATSTLERDQALADIAASLNIPVYRGDETDVLGRFWRASSKVGAGTIVRVCADNPFIDPTEIDRLVAFFRDNSCDYACNHQDRLNSRYADGFGAEILSAALFDQLNDIVKDPLLREHVTLYLWEHFSNYSLLAVPAPAALAHPNFKFDIDTQEDYQSLAHLVDQHGINFQTSAAEIMAIAARQSSTANLVQKQLLLPRIANQRKPTPKIRMTQSNSIGGL